MTQEAKETTEQFHRFWGMTTLSDLNPSLVAAKKLSDLCLVKVSEEGGKVRVTCTEEGYLAMNRFYHLPGHMADVLAFRKGELSLTVDQLESVILARITFNFDYLTGRSNELMQEDLPPGLIAVRF